MNPRKDLPPKAAAEHPLECKARLCKMLALLWSFPSLGSVAILVSNERVGLIETADDAGGVPIRIEVLVAVALLLAHGCLAILARYFDRLNRNRKQASLEA